MFPIPFTCLHLKGHDVIGIAGNKVYITVYSGNDQGFHIQADEKQFYLRLDGAVFIFQTSGYDPLLDPYQLQTLYSSIS